jgi:hypothetical protein
MVDTFEDLAELVPFFTGQFLPGLDVTTRVVLAGRRGLGQLRAQLPAWPQLARPILLGGFSPVEALASHHHAPSA